MLDHVLDLASLVLPAAQYQGAIVGARVVTQELRVVPQGGHVVAQNFVIPKWK